jgi:Arc/MetJ-type ribon-helix-helix transcriptional regulator
VSVPVEIVEEIDELIGQCPGHWRPFGGTHPARRNRSEFVRLAIVEKLEREKKLNT